MKRSISPLRSSKRIRLSDSAETPQQSTVSVQDVITVYSWNVNGISPFLQPSVASYFKPNVEQGSSQGTAKASLRDFLRRHNLPTLLFLQEVKISPDDTATKRAVEKAVRRQHGEPDDACEYEAHFCLPSDKYNARGFGRKVYGVCSVVRKDFSERFVERVRPVRWDVEGRFLVIETKAVGRIPKLAIFNIYAVNGTDNVYKDPASGQVVGTRHDRKLQVHALLQAECRDLESRDFGIVLAGDINVARAYIDGYPNLRTFPKQHCLNRANFEARFFTDPQRRVASIARNSSEPQDENAGDAGLGMIDTFRHLHPEQKSYTYYPRTKSFGESCDRVDMILISRSLKDNLKAAGMHETASERGPSDHIPLFARLEFED